MSWNQRYYDALEFFFWEPQHLGKSKNPTSKLATPENVRRHLRKMEVTLNHQLDFFFELAPVVLQRKIFSTAFGREVEGDLVQFGNDVENYFELPINTTQPDLFFMGDRSVVAIELKAGSKSSIDQALKYSLLGLAADVKSGSDHQHYLGYIAPGQFSDLWKDQLASPDDLKQAMLDAVPSFSRETGTLDIVAHRSRLMRLIENMAIGYMSYAELAALLVQESPGISATSAAEEVYHKLLLGLANELGSELRKNK